MKNLGKERPVCAVEGCVNPALVLLAGDFVCGDCCVRFEKMKNKNLMEQLSISLHQENKKERLKENAN